MRNKDIPGPLGELFDDSPYPMWVFDQETLAFLEVNDAAIRRYGYTRGEFLAMTILDIRPLEDVPQCLRVTLHPRQQRGTLSQRWRHQGRDGQVFWVDVSSEEVHFRGHRAELVMTAEVARLQPLAEVQRASVA